MLTILCSLRGKDQSLVKQIVKDLRKKFELSGGDSLHWFLGIEIIRDREKKLIWLSQSSYIDKIANLAVFKQPDAIPMSKDELLPYDVASFSQTNLYQPIFQTILYLKRHRNLGLQLSEGDKYLMPSDALFAD